MRVCNVAEYGTATPDQPSRFEPSLPSCTVRCRRETARMYPLQLPLELSGAPVDTLRVRRELWRALALTLRRHGRLTVRHTAQDFLHHFARALVSDLAPEISDARIDLSFASTFASIAGLGACEVDCKLEFRHTCRCGPRPLAMKCLPYMCF